MKPGEQSKKKNCPPGCQHLPEDQKQLCKEEDPRLLARKQVRVDVSMYSVVVVKGGVVL